MLDMGSCRQFDAYSQLFQLSAKHCCSRQRCLPSLKKLRNRQPEPKLIEVSPGGRHCDDGRSVAYPVAQESKTHFDRVALNEQEPFERVLFLRGRDGGLERLSHILSARDHSVNRIHADRTQPQREAALRAFSDGRARVLVATDIAAT